MKYIYRPLPQSQQLPHFLPRLNEDLRFISANLDLLQKNIDEVALSGGGGGGAPAVMAWVI